MRELAMIPCAAALLVAGACANQTANQTADAWHGTPAPRFDVVSVEPNPENPNAPVIQSVTARLGVRTPVGRILDVVPDVHFMAPKGNAIVVHRELVDTSGAIAQTQLRDATIAIPAAAQERGAVVSGGWICGTMPYYVTLKAFILDADGDRSNAAEYTIHCNGG